MSYQPFSRSDRNRRARGEHARINRPRPIRRRRNDSVIPTPITAEAVAFREARRRALTTGGCRIVDGAPVWIFPESP